VDVVEHDVLAIPYQIEPLRRTLQGQVLDYTTVHANRAEQDGSILDVLPYSTIAVYRAAAVYIDVGSSELPEGQGILKPVLESILAPVRNVRGELYRPLDVCVPLSSCS
jgi:hypothetical protein